MTTETVKKQEPVAKLYGKALFELAKEQGAADAVAQDLRGLVELVEGQPVLKEALAGYTFSQNEKEKLAAELASKVELHPMVKRFFELLISKNRLTLIGQMYAAFQAFVDESNNVLRGEVVTVEPLTDSEKNELSSAFGKKLKKQVILESVTDKDILGGLIVKIQGLTFDGSLKTTLSRLKENLERQSI